MNIIGIMLDSFRQDHVGVYHGGQPAFADIPPCQTPNLDAFASECVIFDNAYPEALPTIPVRTQFFTGQCTLPYRRWQPLAKEDLSVAEILRDEGYTCGLISDCYHYRAPGMNFHRGFHSYHWIRGQEYDAWMSNPPRRNVEDYVNAAYDKTWRDRVAQYLANTDDFKGEGDWFAAKVVETASDWLTRNRGQRKIFAWIDSFDPHEPWDPPARFDHYTDPAYRGKRLILPMGEPVEQWATPDEVRHMRGLYAGEAESVDYWLGRLFKRLKDLGYYEDSVIVITADHGHPLADHGKFLKGGRRLYSELIKSPFLVRLPGGAGARRTTAIVQFHDLLPTLLELVGLANCTGAMQGRSFLPVLRGDSDAHRPVMITGYYDSPARCMRDHTWSYLQQPEGYPDELYNLELDPRERTNLIDQHPEEARRLVSHFGHLFRGKGQVIKGIQGQYEMASGSVA
jgi:arylsulfatase A-like enzyme